MLPKSFSTQTSRWTKWSIITGSVIFAMISVSAVLATVTVTLTDEVYGNNMSGRRDAAALNDQWITDTKDAGYTCFYQLTSIITGTGGFTDTGNGNTNTEISGILGSSAVTISNRDMTNITVITDTGALGGAATIRSSLARTLQDGSPMPDPNPNGDGGTDGWFRVNDGSAWEYWNETSGSNSSRNAVLFEFDPPTPAFGVFLGDLETRTDGSGTTAELRYKISGGDVITQIIDTSTVTQSNCGNDYDGCGNQSTRWIGVRGSIETFDWIIIIVGDDDATGQTDGNRESLSWVGATTAEEPQGGNCPTPTEGSDPTAVTLQSITASGQAAPLAIPAFSIITALFSSIMLWQRKRS